jgi:phenylacetate-CoA ligase
MKATELALLVSHFARARWRWQHLAGDALQRYQDRRARQMITYTLRHSPFYCQHWSGHDPTHWQTLPTVNKQLMMEHFDTFNTRGIRRDDAMEVALHAERNRNFRPLLNGLTVGLSSGTSGHRGLFLVSPWEQVTWAGIMLARTLHQIRAEPLRAAFFLRSNSNLYEQIGRGPITFRYFDLMLPLEDAVAALNQLDPQIVIGPPSLLGFLATEREQGRLRIHPERLIAVAEVLEPHDRTRFETIFHASIHQVYQCTEGFIATSCASGSLHIQEDLVAVQFEPLPGDHDGEQERVTPIITDLWRHIQPIIRYRLNDILQLAPQPCHCGSAFRVISAIEGRSDDVCYFESQTKGLRPFFPDTLRRMILLASPDIVDYQIVQASPGHLHIFLALPPHARFNQVENLVCQSVATTLASYGCRLAKVDVEEGLPMLPPGVKRRRVQRVQANDTYKQS